MKCVMNNNNNIIIHYLCCTFHVEKLINIILLLSLWIVSSRGGAARKQRESRFTGPRPYWIRSRPVRGPVETLFGSLRLGNATGARLCV